MLIQYNYDAWTIKSIWLILVVLCALFEICDVSSWWISEMRFWYVICVLRWWMELRWWLCDSVMYCGRIILSLFYLLIKLWGIWWWEQPQVNGPSIRQKKKRNYGWEFSNCGRVFGKEMNCDCVFSKSMAEVLEREKRNMAEVSANSRGCQFDKQTWKRKKKGRDWCYMVCLVESLEVVCCDNFILHGWLIL